MYTGRGDILRFSPTSNGLLREIRSAKTDACRQNPISRSGFAYPLEEKAQFMPVGNIFQSPSFIASRSVASSDEAHTQIALLITFYSLQIV